MSAFIRHQDASLLDVTATGTPTPKYPNIEARHDYTKDQLRALAALSDDHFGKLGSITERACIYMTGSIARDEATTTSDLDLFVVDELEPGESLTYVEESRLVAHLDNVRADAGFRAFSRGGHFVRHQSFQNMKRLLGDPEDDFTNCFTARMLLLINSVPLLNKQGYERAREQVVDLYWDPRAETRYRPIMLTNDLRRWWGVLCLNFERNNRPEEQGSPTREGPTRRIANLKLRYARAIAVYSVMWGLLHTSASDGSMTREQLLEVLNRTPVRRMLAVVGDESLGNEVRAMATKILEGYDEYLGFMDRNKEELTAAVSESDVWSDVKMKAYEYHELLAKFTREIGADNALLDYILV